MLHVSTGCRRQLPPVLIDYIERLALEGEERSQTFLLTPKQTGSGPVQDILIRCGRTASWRRVFGYEPVRAVVEVFAIGGEWYMALDWEIHPAMTGCGGKEVAV